jgi:glycosyltransferase involved in cell wall biosynthesis
MRDHESKVWPKVTIAILSWNRFHYFKATIESARRCIQYPNIDWIVSDNISDEPGLIEYIKGLDWVQEKIFKRQTHAEAMNEIVEKATGKYLIIWPDDVQFITEGPWLKDLIELLNRNSEIGSVALDAQRLVTLQRILKPDMLTWMSCTLRDLYLYRHNVRRSRRISSSTGFEAWTAGSVMSGICGSGIPSLTRTEIWKILGPWKTLSQTQSGLIDSSLGAEENMYLRFIDSRLPLQTLFPMVPIAADIITDPLGCKAKVRGRYRYGVYMPPQDSSGFYYETRKIDEITTTGRELPFSFSEMVQPLGFSIPMDGSGDRLKYPLNTSIVFDTKILCEVKYPLALKAPK